MAKSRALDKRRKSIRSIHKITRTMELIATAQFKKAMEKAIAADSYTKRLNDLVHDLTKSGDQYSHPLLVERKQDRSQKDVTLLVLSANRGMCGGFNAGVMRLATQRLKDFQHDYSGVALDVSGKRGISSFKFRGSNIDNAYIHLQDKPTLDKVTELADKYLEEFITDKIDRLDVCYTKFESLNRQYAVIETLLPMVELTSEGDVNSIRDNPEFSDVSLKRAAMVKQADEITADRVDKGLSSLAHRGNTLFDFLPSPDSVLEELIPKAFKAKLFKCFLDSTVSEQIARMVAMKAATENADKMISMLTTTYNRARQSQITSEILEIISGAEALE
ncbi:MAG: ATP synthase F1 subunit gamma [Planctomycetaceae bacterium]|jgi:F-type H+-transporting ATPase subunit gamma|nr:ATP synthase F1 subunit gamma [Planctomycetaceae bacterium]